MMHQQPTDYSSLVYLFYEQLYRVALLITGSPASAAALVDQTYQRLPFDAADSEQRLIAGLLTWPERRKPQRMAPNPDRIANLALDVEQAQALLDTIQSMSVAERLLIGLHYLRGLSAEVIVEVLNAPNPKKPTWSTERVAETLTRLRIRMAHLLGLVPATVDEALLRDLDRFADGSLPADDALELRGAIFEFADIRAARDALAKARLLLQQAVPALFASAPPADLLERLLKRTARRTQITQHSQFNGARLLLAVGVLALVVAIIWLPGWLREPDTVALERAPTAAEVLENAQHRFERANITSGVLYEQYRISAYSMPVYLVERWYDYASPHRLRITVRGEDGEGRPTEPLMESASDGQRWVQFRIYNSNESFDAQVSFEDAQAAITVLRNGITPGTVWSSLGTLLNPIPQYITQARASNPVYLGRSTFQDRAAYLISYRTERLSAQLPDSSMANMPVQVILTIDAQTYAVLDVAVVLDGVAESVPVRPVQIEQIALLNEVDESIWRITSNPWVRQLNGLPSVRIPEVLGQQRVPIDNVLQRVSKPLLAPQQLPDTSMRGMAIALSDSDPNSTMLLYEGEFTTFALLPLQHTMTNVLGSFEHEYEVGPYRYVQIMGDGLEDSSITMLVFSTETPEEQYMLFLLSEQSTATERVDALSTLIGSLTPLTSENLPSLQHHFNALLTAGG